MGNQLALLITPEKVIVNLLKVDKKKYLSISRLYKFVAFLRQQLLETTDIGNDMKIIFDINFDSIERTVQFNDMVYDLIGDKIYLKGILPSQKDDDDRLSALAEKFAEQYAA